MISDKKLALFKQMSNTSSIEGGSDIVVENQKTAGEKDWLKYLSNNRQEQKRMPNTVTNASA